MEERPARVVPSSPRRFYVAAATAAAAAAGVELINRAAN